MLGELSREMKSDSSLDLPAGDGVLLVIVGQSRSLSSHSLKDVIDKGVHDAHGLRGDTSVRMDLLEDLVDVDRVALFACLLGLPLLPSWLWVAGDCSLLGGDFSRHVEL